MSMTDFFAPPASHSLKFTTPGEVFGGEIKEISEPMQCTDYGTNKPSFWPSGDPMMQAKITLATDLRDPEDPKDDGKRGLWVVQSGKAGGLLAAIRDAIKESGAGTIEPGGHLEVAFVGTDPESKNPANPRKLYQARYKAPAAAGGMFGGAPTTGENQMNRPAPAPAPAPVVGQQAAFAQPVQQQVPAARAVGEPGPFQQSMGQPQQWPPTDAQPTQQQAPAPVAGPQVSAEQESQIKQLLAMNFDDAAIANALGDPNVTADTIATYRA